MNQFPTTTLSDVAFSQKIINKYQKGKRYPFSFPLMIFYKNIEPGLSLQMNVDLLVQLQLHTQKRGAFVLVKNVQTVKRLASWPGFEKLVPQCIITQALLQRVRSIHKIFPRIREATISQLLSATHISVNRVPRVPSIQSAHSQVTNRTAVDVAFYPQVAYYTFLSGGILFPFSRGGVLSRSQIPFGHPIPEISSHLWKAKPPSIYSHTETLQSMQLNLSLLMGLTGRDFLTAKQGIPLLMKKASGGVMEYLLPSLFPTYTSEVLNHREHVLGKWNAVRQTWGSKNNLIPGLTRQYHSTQNARILQSLLSIAPPVFYPQVTYQISSTTMEHHSPLKQGDYTQMTPPPRAVTPDTLVPGNVGPYSSIQKMKVAGHHSLSLLGNNKVLFNTHKELFTNAVQNRMVVHRAFIQRTHKGVESGEANSTPIQRRNIFEASKDNLSFRSQRKIEQEVENIKKLVVETKQAVLERTTPMHPSGEADRKRQIDMHDLSDQVYQLIDHKIKIEAERRGLL